MSNRFQSRPIPRPISTPCGPRHRDDQDENARVVTRWRKTKPSSLSPIRVSMSLGMSATRMRHCAFRCTRLLPLRSGRSGGHRLQADSSSNLPSDFDKTALTGKSFHRRAPRGPCGVQNHKSRSSGIAAVGRLSVIAHPGVEAGSQVSAGRSIPGELTILLIFIGTRQTERWSGVHRMRWRSQAATNSREGS
jgi:hypothetical protein